METSDSPDLRGRGVVDGLIGTVKRAVWRHVRSGQVHRTTAEEYAKIAEQHNLKRYTCNLLLKGDMRANKATIRC